MGIEDLTPAALIRVLGTLDLGHSLVMSILRGRSVTEEEVARVRQAVVGLRKTLDALDERRPWDLAEGQITSQAWNVRVPPPPEEDP